MRWNARTRTGIACAGAACIFTVFSARLIELQVAKHDYYARLAAEMHTYKEILHAKRGVILDCNGELLAANLPVSNVIADGSHVKDPDKLAAVAAPFLGMDSAKLAQMLRTGRKYVPIKNELAEEKAVQLGKVLEDQKIHGLFFEPDNIRIYPNGPMLGHVIGFTDRTREGVMGVERTMDKYLNGQDGYRYIEHDRTGREIVLYRGQERAAQDGMKVRLTIDMGLQNIVESEIDAAYKQFKPESVTCIMVRPSTGEVLAMANRPCFDPNDLNDVTADQTRNRAITDIVEPGSTFKIVASSGAVNEKLVTPSTIIYCEDGHFAYGNKILHDHKPYGDMTVHDILMKSSNIGAAKLALMMGNDRFYEYERNFGFGQRTGVELPGEVNGLLPPTWKWDKLTITRMAMGQSVAVTPMQMIMGMSVIANGGRLMKPFIVKSIEDPDQDGKVIVQNQPTVLHEVIPKSVADYINSGLMAVVSPQGTAVLAKVPGFECAGKTGTAEKINPHGGYLEGKYVDSFVGYMPAEKPEFVCLVMINDPKVTAEMNYGGMVAAPVFSRIGDRAARYLDLTPTQPVVPVQAPVALSDGGGDKRD